MNTAPLSASTDFGHDDTLFEAIAKDIEAHGYSIKPNALPDALTSGLYQHVVKMPAHLFHSAGIGRGDLYLKNQFVRRDKICWIEGNTPSGFEWLAWSNALMRYLNRRLFLGLHLFESHFAHYKPGDFYKLHFDAFKGEANRRLSLVAYLNPGWQLSDGGELVIYPPGAEKDPIKVIPLLGTLVVFLSEDFAHEVLPATKDRFSVAGWYRIQTNPIPIVTELP